MNEPLKSTVNDGLENQSLPLTIDLRCTWESDIEERVVLARRQRRVLLQFKSIVNGGLRLLVHISFWHEGARGVSASTMCTCFSRPSLTVHSSGSFTLASGMRGSGLRL